MNECFSLGQPNMNMSCEFCCLNLVKGDCPVILLGPSTCDVPIKRRVSAFVLMIGRVFCLLASVALCKRMFSFLM